MRDDVITQLESDNRKLRNELKTIKELKEIKRERRERRK